MKTSRFVLLVCLFEMIQAQPTFAQETATPPPRRVRGWWNASPVPPTRPTANPKALPLISVRGNVFVNSPGDTILFRGLAIPDPEKLEGDGRWNRDIFAKIKELGANIVRVPVHPIAWREVTPEKYLAMLSQAIEWCTELHIYVMIDWHSIGNLKTALFQDPIYNTSLAETFEFWRDVSHRFSGHNTVAFYELFNEPTTFSNKLGRMSWDEWKCINEEIIALIRAYDKETIPLVAGLDWAYDLSPLHNNPVEAEGIGYVTHPYPHKRSPPWIPKWEENFGFAASQYPVLATEFGFTPGNEGEGSKNEYGITITSYLEGKGIGWIGWIFDPEWGPPLLKSWEGFPLTESGKFFEAALQRQPVRRR